MIHLEFLERKLDGTINNALGSDGTWFNVGSCPTPKLHEKALAHARSLRSIGKRYLGYRFVSGPDYKPTGHKPVLFSNEELSK